MFLAVSYYLSINLKKNELMESEFLSGTNGGVTLMGIIMSAAGGLAVGLAYYIALLFRLNSDILDASICQWPLILTGLFGGLIGSLIDSFLGATCQFSGKFYRNFKTRVFKN